MRDLLLLLLMFGVLVGQLIVGLTPYCLVRLCIWLYDRFQRRKENQLDPITKMLIEVVLKEDDKPQ